MTREEAKRVLEFDLDHTHNNESKEALRMAIKAVEKEPSTDAISRQAALDCLTVTKLKKFDFILQARAELKNLPPVTLRSMNPEADREKSKAYCAECDHIEMCSWYPHDGCEWLKTDRYNAGYNTAKREIALSGEYERAYERGKADAQPKTGHWSRVSMDKYVQHAMAYYRCSECGKDIIGEHTYCPNCGCRMVEPQERSGKE